MTDRHTDGLTTLVDKSLSRLKTVFKMKSHMQIEHYIAKCLECKKIMHTKTRFRHVCGNKKFKCSKCNFETLWMSNLKDHEKSVHNTQLLTVKCDSCEKMFRSERLMLIHKVKDHNGGFDCHHCDKSFSTCSNLIRHIKREVCRFKVKRKRLTKKVKHEQKCIHCTYKTFIGGNLRRHMKTCLMRPRTPVKITSEIYWDVVAKYLLSNKKAFGILQDLKLKLKRKECLVYPWRIIAQLKKLQNILRL